MADPMQRRLDALGELAACWRSDSTATTLRLLGEVWRRAANDEARDQIRLQIRDNLAHIESVIVNGIARSFLPASSPTRALRVARAAWVLLDPADGEESRDQLAEIGARLGARIDEGRSVHAELADLAEWCRLHPWPLFHALRRLCGTHPPDCARRLGS